MSKIFDIVDNKVVVNPQSLNIPEFKVIWDRDKTKYKGSATKEISYIVYLCDESVDNPYRAYNEIEREQVILKDFMESGWVPDEVIKKAIEKFKDLKQTTNSRLLRSAKKAAEKLSEYFDSVDFNVKDVHGKPVFSSRDLASNLKEVAGIVKSLNTLEEMVRREQSESSNIRGGGDVGFYETPRDDFDYGVEIDNGI